MVAHFSIPDVCSQPEATVFCPARALGPTQRQDLALHALAGTESISRLAAQHEVSGKFIYQQVGSAKETLQEAFRRETFGEKSERPGPDSFSRIPRCSRRRFTPFDTRHALGQTPRSTIGCGLLHRYSTGYPARIILPWIGNEG